MHVFEQLALGLALAKKMVTKKAGTSFVLCSLALFVFPLFIFFFAYSGGFDQILLRLIKTPISSYARSVTGAILAVITVNAVLIAFVITAFNETPEEIAKKQN